MKTLVYATHITAGSIALLAGYVALYSAKGAVTHKRVGMLFVYAMLVMAITGATVAAVRGSDGSTIGGLLTCYFVITALTTVREPAGWSKRMDIVITSFAAIVAIGAWTFGTLAALSPSGLRDGLPPFPFFMFGAAATVAIIGDVRVMLRGPLTGAPRLRRHLWRMCWSLWIAAGSFFFGQSKFIPEPLRKPMILAIPVLAVFASMFYWLWRTRARRRRPLGSIVTLSTPEMAKAG